MVQVGVLLFELGQIFLAFALLAVVDDDDFELRIVLLKDSGQVAAQVFHFVVGAEDDRQRRQFLCEVQFVASGLATAQVDAVVEGEVVEGLDDEQDAGSGQQVLFGSVECECFHYISLYNKCCAKVRIFVHTLYGPPFLFSYPSSTGTVRKRHCGKWRPR